MRKFAVFDIDGTLIRWQLYHAIADELVKLGFTDAEDYQIVKDARLKWKRREEHEAFRAYEIQLVRAYETVLTKLTFEQFEKAAIAVFEEYKDQVYTYTRALIKELKAKGYLLFAISGSQIEIVEKIANHYGFDDCVGTLYERGKTGFTGKVDVTRLGKHLILQQLANKHSATYKGSVGVGDTESDITMLEAVDQPIAFNPTKQLLDHAMAKNWTIVVERKNVVYSLSNKGQRYQLD